MNEFDKVMLTLYGPDWDKKIDRDRMMRQFNANKQNFRNAVFNKQKKEAGQLLAGLPNSEPELPNATIPSISTGPIVDASRVPGANNKSRTQLAGEIMLSRMPKNNSTEEPENIVPEKKAVVEFGDLTIAPEIQTYTDPETGIEYDINSPEYREYYQNYLTKRRNKRIEREGRLGEAIGRSAMNNEAFSLGAPLMFAAAGVAGASALSGGTYGVNAANVINSVKNTGKVIRTVASNTTKRVPEIAEDARLAADRTGMYIYRNLSGTGRFANSIRQTGEKLNKGINITSKGVQQLGDDIASNMERFGGNLSKGSNLVRQNVQNDASYIGSRAANRIDNFLEKVINTPMTKGVQSRISNLGNMYKFRVNQTGIPNAPGYRVGRFQQGGQVSQQNAQQQFVAYIAEIFGIQNEAQLKQVVSKLGKQGIAQLQKAFQQGIPAEQVRKQMQGGTQSAKQGARITKTGDFVPCAKCGGKAKKKRFGDGGEVQHAGCGCSEIRKGCNGMSFMAKCGGRTKKVSKKEDGGTVPETYGRPIGGATVLPFLLKNSNKKSKRFSER